jgi:hypothetical protein
MKYLIKKTDKDGTSNNNKINVNQDKFYFKISEPKKVNNFNLKTCCFSLDKSNCKETFIKEGKSNNTYTKLVKKSFEVLVSTYLVLNRKSIICITKHTPNFNSNYHSLHVKHEYLKIPEHKDSKFHNLN